MVLQSIPHIPRRPKPALIPPVEEAPIANGTSVTGKRKREGEDGDGDETMTNGHVAKKVAGESSNGDGNDLIVLDDDDGAILIDD